MPGKAEADAVPALRPRGMQVKDAERHRQAFAAIDDPHQVGVLQIVVGQLVAAIAVFQEDDLVERPGPRGEVAAGSAMPPDIARDRREVLAIAYEADARPLEGSEGERGFADRQDRRGMRRE